MTLEELIKDREEETLAKVFKMIKEAYENGERNLSFQAMF